MLNYIDKLYPEGFNFENYLRNSYLTSSNKEVENNFTKTGTTIVGIKYKGGVILAADTRATAERIADKNCDKIHFIAPNITCCGAGTAADCEYYTKQLSAELELMRLNTNRESKISTLVCKATNHLFKYGGYIGAYLIVAGFDEDGPHLVKIMANGYCAYGPYLAMGSGSISADAELEKGYRDDLTFEEAKQLAIKAITAGIMYDLASGSNVDFVHLTKGKIQHYRNYVVVGKKEVTKAQPYRIIPRNIPILKQQRISFEKVKVNLEDDNKMIIEEN
jgi:20S proteasome subunit beta 2